ncbi:cation acetate symporter [Pyrofollis japonicus]|uniref:sodium:solute symporter family protein n=1 Tax=Pyrofollis japonicus TaxID=3060460 RepID=UPI00295B21F8|nr:sodium:solute symporter family protein [Pyrofollis japonicus]BEP17946.1 cation acetate symporter [Pyrofollis japonicus]
MDVLAVSFLTAAIALYMFIAYRARAATAEEFYVAGRRVSPIRNGMATAADWMSGASFISMAGAVAILGYDASVFLIGWSLSYVLLAMAIAPFLRSYGKYTVPDFFEDRYYSKLARIFAVVMLYVVSLTYLTGQLLGVGIVLSRAVGASAALMSLIAPLIVILYSSFGGMKSITWTQVAQYVVLISAYWLPIVLLTNLWHPIPHVAYGGHVEKVDEMVMQLKDHAWTEPFWRPYADGHGQLNWLLATLALMLGTMGLPHVLMRFYTVPSVKDARKSVAWALFFIGLLYLTAPVYAALAGEKEYWLALQFKDLVGHPISEAQQRLAEIAAQHSWVAKWHSAGLIKIVDLNHNGVFDSLKELSIHKDIAVLGLPDMYGLGAVVASIILVGGISAALSTADGLLLAMTTAATRDIYKSIINPRASDKQELRIARISMVLIAFFSGLLAYVMAANPKIGAYIAKTVGWAFAFAASTLTPAMILGIHWKRTTKEGAIAGMLAGLAVTVPYVVLLAAGKIHPVTIAGQAIGSIAWGTIGFTVNLIVTIVVSLLTPPPPKNVQDLVEKVRVPILAEAPSEERR